LGSCCIIAVLGFLLGSAAFADSANSTDLLVRAQAANDTLFGKLQAFVCEERIERFRGKVGTGSPRPLDTITARVSFEDGVEQYSAIKQNDRPLSSLGSVHGAWSQGEFGTLLRQTRQLLDSHPATFLELTDVNRRPAAHYRFEVSEEDSPWDLIIDSHHYRIPFRSQVWVSPATGEILKVARTSLAMPAGMDISEIRWAVILEPVVLKGESWLLPATGEYTVVYADSNRRDSNHLSFSNYQHYGSETALHFNTQ
jgi:hypothetical protein